MAGKKPCNIQKDEQHWQLIDETWVSQSVTIEKKRIVRVHEFMEKKRELIELFAYDFYCQRLFLSTSVYWSTRFPSILLPVEFTMYSVQVHWHSAVSICIPKYARFGRLWNRVRFQGCWEFIKVVKMECEKEIEWEKKWKTWKPNFMQAAQ